MIRKTLAAPLLLASACSSTPPLEKFDTDLIISGISQGKMRNIDGTYQIYEHTSDMEYEVNDSCIYNQQKIDCLRHGFIIRYNSFGQNVKLDCIAETNITVNAGNTEREKYVDTNKDDFYIELSADKNEFINPQYVSGQPGLDDLYVETTCMHKEESIIQFSQRIRF